jgi:predicted PhzF superfamily epimerase YddE/YHI9
VPDFAEKCLRKKPVAAATVGSANDYLILELADANAVRLAEPDIAAMTAASRRAFIVTARTDDTEPACVFRYFAPQYGAPEDDATGSAAVQLAAYWAPRMAATRFPARQLSAGGATMVLSCQGDTVELAAHVGYG